MHCNVITNLNGYGLQRDYEVIRAVLENQGCRVRAVQFNDSKAIATAHLNVFLEVVVPSFFCYARQNWLIPNPEWWDEQPNDQYLPRMSRVLCKTRDSLRLFSARVGARAEYVGFESIDVRIPTVPREAKFLHIAGKSEAKNTAEIIEAWAKYQLPYPLSLVTTQDRFIEQAKGVPQITHYAQISNTELTRLMNSHQFHLCPSKYEGWGHYFHEALSVGAIMLTTNAPPMNEFAGVDDRLRIPAKLNGKQRLGGLYDVSSADIAERVHQVASLSEAARQAISSEARRAFENESRQFRTKLTRLVGDPSRFTGRRLTVAVFGNHTASYCTESELDWTFEHLGHKVLKFQEGSDTTDAILKQCLAEKVDLFLYIHTHGWNTSGTITVEQLIESLRGNSVATASFHLDLYWGLNGGDKREDRVGSHPFWSTDYVFTADGGHQQQFEARGVKHFWLPPAVVERDCYAGTPQNKFKIDVGFVGSRSYHSEYPFRAQLVDWLEQTYGHRFKRFNGDTTGVIRGKELNDLYASVKVMVGDSCFAGIPRYWSDRVPETLGRGGFLIHPEVDGLDIPGLVTYQPGDFNDLKQKIDYYLEHDEERQECVAQASEAVRMNHTYTNRVLAMLETMGLNTYVLETGPYAEPPTKLSSDAPPTKLSPPRPIPTMEPPPASDNWRAGIVGAKVERLVGMGYEVVICTPGSPTIYTLRQQYPDAIEERVEAISGVKILLCIKAGTAASFVVPNSILGRKLIQLKRTYDFVAVLPAHTQGRAKLLRMFAGHVEENVDLGNGARVTLFYVLK